MKLLKIDQIKGEEILARSIMTDDFHELFKLKAKRDISNLDFYRVISPAFIHEWERLKNAKKDEKKTTG